MANILRKIIENDKGEIKKLEKTAKKVESYADAMAALSDEELQAKTEEFKQRYQNGESLDQLLPEAFAVVREGAKRVLGLFPYRVQIMGGIVLHHGDVPEMRTGEGKTLTATMPVYLNAISGEGVHVITVNEYLSERDATEMGELYSWLGLSVGINLSAKSPAEKREAYNCDITYSTNSEVGFDYLRDNMVVRKENMVQRPLNYALVDEVDSVLIDEARTPLIVSGPVSSETNQLYHRADAFVKTLTEDDYAIDIPTKTIGLNDSGIDKAEEFFNLDNLYDIDNVALTHYIDNALRANYIMLRDIDYVVSPEQEILIVDQFTGRTMEGRRFSDGLHQAIEAKEGVPVQEETKTSASITYQNMFRMYKKLSGMTGTGKTEEDEFREIYNMRIIPIPTNRPIQRIDHDDLLYSTLDAKFRAVVQDVKRRYEKGQPVLVGTVAVETSDLISKMLVEAGIPHEVLNAKHHDREAMIVAQAGKYGAVTIATNMAGRGTDIMLGGNAEYKSLADLQKMGYSEEVAVEAAGFSNTQDEEVLAARAEYKKLYAKYSDEVKELAEKVREAGGLYIIGTERHESRRIDNQLRGRSGRQGDPGESTFFLSLEDDLMRIFGGERITAMMDTLKVDENTPIQSKMLTGVIESSQKKIEGRNFNIRKNVLNYDDVMNTQREIIYKQRQQVLDGEDLHENILGMIKEFVEDSVNMYITDEDVQDNWNLQGLKDRLMGIITVEDDFNYTPQELDEISKQDIIDLLEDRALKIYAKREEDLGQELLHEIERVVLLKVVDTKWMAHIDDMDELKKGIGLRSYGQKNPVVEYRMEGMDMFDDMVASIREDTVRMLFTIQVRKNSAAPKREDVLKPGEHHNMTVRKAKKPGRNDLCPCGSGKKYKNCCGAGNGVQADEAEQAENSSDSSEK